MKQDVEERGPNPGDENLTRNKVSIESSTVQNLQINIFYQFFIKMTASISLMQNCKQKIYCTSVKIHFLFQLRFIFYFENK